VLTAFSLYWKQEHCKETRFILVWCKPANQLVNRYLLSRWQVVGLSLTGTCSLPDWYLLSRWLVFALSLTGTCSLADWYLLSRWLVLALSLTGTCSLPDFVVHLTIVKQLHYLDNLKCYSTGRIVLCNGRTWKSFKCYWIQKQIKPFHTHSLI